MFVNIQLTGLLLIIAISVFFRYYLVTFLPVELLEQETLLVFDLLGKELSLPPWFTFLIGIGNLMLIYFIGCRVFNHKIAIIAAFLYAVSPWIFYFEVANSAYILLLFGLLLAFLGFTNLHRGRMFLGLVETVLGLLILLYGSILMWIVVPVLIFGTLRSRYLDYRNIKSVVLVIIFLSFPLLFLGMKNIEGVANIRDKQISFVSDVGLINAVNQFRGEVNESELSYMGRIIENRYIYFTQHLTFNFVEHFAPVVYFTPELRMLGFSFSPPLPVGFLLFLKMFEGRWYFAILSSFALVLSMYTYHTERLFIPLMVGAFTLFYWKKMYLQKKNLFIFAITFLLFVLPLFVSTIFGPDKTRAQSTLIINDVEYQRNVLVEKSSFNAGFFSPVVDFLTHEHFLLFFHWIRKFLNYFHPAFLFYNGLNMTQMGTYGLGVLYLFELPFLILGTYFLIRSNKLVRKIIIAWILLGIFPASLTQNEQHPLRTLIILPMVVLISGMGFAFLFNLIRDKIRGGFNKLIYMLFGAFVAWNLTYALLIFSVHFPNQRGEAFMEGTKETVEYALANIEQYDEILFDPVRGVDGPYIVSIPHMYILFYSKYDPKIYQDEVKEQTGDAFKFGKFTIRPIDWRVDRARERSLFIGSPWSLPERDIKQEEVLKKVYLTNGGLAFLIVSPKQH